MSETGTMSDRPTTEETRDQVSEGGAPHAKSGVGLLKPLISVLARQIATEYGHNNAGHTELARWPYQLAFILGVVAIYYFLRS